MSIPMLFNDSLEAAKPRPLPRSNNDRRYPLRLETALSFLVLLLACAMSGCGIQLHGVATEQRTQIDAMASSTIEELTRLHPGIHREIHRSAGYGVFDASGGKILWGGMDHGNGLVVNNQTHQRTYMKMLELQPGIGFGFTNFRLVFIFDTLQALSDFVNSGWEFGGRASAAANDRKENLGGDLATNVASGIRLYQLTEQGAMVGLSITGARYWRNDELND